MEIFMSPYPERSVPCRRCKDWMGKHLWQKGEDERWHTFCADGERALPYLSPKIKQDIKRLYPFYEPSPFQLTDEDRPEV